MKYWHWTLVRVTRLIKSAVPGLDLSGNPTNRELASSPAQNEAFTTRTVEAAEALFVGKGQQLTGTPRCLSLQGVGLQAF